MLSAKGLSVSFGRAKAFENFSFSLPGKKRLAIIGPNGSGKTSLGFALASIIPDFIEGRIAGKIEAPSSVSLVMQNPSTQFISMTVEEELHGVNIRGFNAVHLLHKNVFELSEGEKQKINLISNLSQSPGAILLDEPLELLDPLEAKRFMQVLSKTSVPMLWLDKSDEFVKEFPKAFLGKSQKPMFPAKKQSILGEQVLSASICIERNGFFLPGIELQLYRGEKLGLIGLNGSGKTSLLKALAGVQKPSGNVDRKLPVSFAPQNPSHLFFRETVQEEIRCLENIEKFCIKPFLSRNPSKLSKGQQKLVSVASVLPNTIALLDEPTTWLDAANRSLVYNFINDAQQPMVIATHDRKLLDYCDRILLVEAGKGVRECSRTAANRFFRT